MSWPDTYLQKGEKGNLTRVNKRDANTKKVIEGEVVIRKLLIKIIILRPMVIDPHGQLGLLTRKLLFGTHPGKPIVFNKRQVSRP